MLFEGDYKTAFALKVAENWFSYLPVCLLDGSRWSWEISSTMPYVQRQRITPAAHWRHTSLQRLLQVLVAQSFID
jgi:hypothetical protein